MPSIRPRFRTRHVDWESFNDDYRPGEIMIGRFSIGFEQTHARVFNSCFTIMDRELRFNISELEDSFRLNEVIPDLLARVRQTFLKLFNM